MHDQLRDLAYSIVREEGSIARRTRLLGKDAEDALKDAVRACLAALWLGGCVQQVCEQAVPLWLFAMCCHGVSRS